MKNMDARYPRIKVRAYQAPLMVAGGLAIGLTAYPARAEDPKPKWALAPSEFFSDMGLTPSAMVDAADLNGDGWIDLVFANYDGDAEPGESPLQLQQAFYSDGQGQSLVDVSAAVFGGELYAARAVKLRDIDRDGDVDIFLGTTWESQSQLLINDGSGVFANETAIGLPPVTASVGDVEFGDLDLDGDLDIVLSDWGPGSASLNAGGVPLIWLQEGMGIFVDETLQRMPDSKVRWSHDLELADVNNDGYLDIVVSSYADPMFSYYLFINDGTGKFSVSPMVNAQKGKYGLGTGVFDLDDDGWVDLVTLHDSNSRDRLLRGGADGFSVAVNWTNGNNSLSEDHGVAYYDWNSDGKVEFLLGASHAIVNGVEGKYPDRVIYTENGALKQDLTAFSGDSPKTSALVVADFNRDARLDVAMAQRGYDLTKHVFLATGVVPVDSRAPTLSNIGELRPVDGDGPLQYPGTARLRLRCHDGKSPLMLHDFWKPQGWEPDGRPHIEYWLAEPVDEAQKPDDWSAPGVWYGEYLWQVDLELPDTAKLIYRVCAQDAVGNKRCGAMSSVEIEGGGAERPPPAGSTGEDPSSSSTTTGGGESVSTSTSGETGTENASSGAPTTSGATFWATSWMSTTGAETSSSTDSGVTGVYSDEFDCECRTSRGRSVVGDLASVLLILAFRPRRWRRC